MPRSGHCEPLHHGSDLAAVVGYRLAGLTPQKSASRQAQEAQVDYRLGAGSVDSRQVWFLGSGGTADLLAYRPGERLTAADGQIVRDAMFGIDRATGERIRVRMERNRAARIAAAPYHSVLTEACEQGGVDSRAVYTGRDLAAQLRALTAAAARRNGTVAIRSAEGILRSNEHAWTTYQDAIQAGRTCERPAFRLDRGEVMRRLGAHHRALQEAGFEQEFGETRIDLTLPDEDLGRAIWAHVDAESRVMVERGNAGYEMTLTCPKSFSVAALIAPPEQREQWLDAVHAATVGAVDELMRRVSHGRSGHEGDGQIAPAIRGLGYAATVSIEAHSRELDPHLHGHMMVPNRVLCIDGKERATASGGADFVNHAWWLQAEFERRLRAISTAGGLVAGWEMNLDTRQWEVAGADPDVMAFYSQAQALVHAETRAALEDEPHSVDRARLQLLDSRAKRKVTRLKGDQVLTWAQIRDHMTTRAKAAGIDLAQAFTLPRLDEGFQPEQWTDDIWARSVEEMVCEHKGAEIDARIEAAVRCFAPHHWDETLLAHLVRVVKEREFTPGDKRARGRVGTRKHGSNRVADAESRACDAFTAGFDTNPHQLTRAHAAEGLEQWRQRSGWANAGREFTAGQEALFWQMTCGPDRVSTVVGAAGSGKTTAIDAAREALAAQGLNVFGICVAAIAAQALRDTAKVQAGTVTWLTTRIDFATNPLHPARAHAERLAISRHRRDRAQATAIRRRYAIPPMDHLVIDEASMIPATDMATVLEWTAEHGITVTLIGDHRQLQPVGPSALFAQFHATRPGAELTENLRQQTDIGRECAAFLRDGHPEEAFHRLADAGQFVVVSSQTEAEHVLIQQWATRAAQCPTAADRLRSTGLESDRNDQVDILNAHARIEARARGWITGDDVAFTHRGARAVYATGDQIVITKNIHRPGHPVLANGTRALATAVSDDGVDVTYWDGDGDHVQRLSRAQAVTHARHGYAMTTHKLQGQTVKSLVIDVGPDRDLSSAYVAFTRHQDDVYAVVNIADIAQGPELERLMAAGPDARRDAVIAMTAHAIQNRGFSDSPTAHEAIGQPLPLQSGTPGHTLGGL